MDNFNDSDFKLPRATLSGNVYEGVKKRVINIKQQATKNRRQIAIGSALLLVISLVNGFLLMAQKEPPKQKHDQRAEMLFNAFFEKN